MNSNACLSTDQLSEFLAGENDDTVAVEVHSHIANCKKCRSELNRVQNAFADTEKKLADCKESIRTASKNSESK